jgi:hypothetical protein
MNAPKGKCPYCQSEEPCFNGKSALGVQCQHPEYRPDEHRLAFWAAINEYAAACGGDTSGATISNRIGSLEQSIGRSL